MYSPHRATFEVAGPTATLVDEQMRAIAKGRNKNCTHTYAVRLPAHAWLMRLHVQHMPTTA